VPEKKGHRRRVSVARAGTQHAEKRVPVRHARGQMERRRTIGERHCGAVIVNTTARKGAGQRSTGHPSRPIGDGVILCAFRRSASPLRPTRFGKIASPKTEFLIDRGYRLEMPLSPAISMQTLILIVAESAYCRSDFSRRHRSPGVLCSRFSKHF
jgi:hypothetical protein